MPLRSSLATPPAPMTPPPIEAAVLILSIKTPLATGRVAIVCAAALAGTDDLRIIRLAPKHLRHEGPEEVQLQIGRRPGSKLDCSHSSQNRSQSSK